MNQLMNGRVKQSDLLANIQAVKSFYDEQGFIIVEDAFTDNEVSALCMEGVRVAKGERGPVTGLLDDDVTGLSDDEIISNYNCIHFPHKISEMMYHQISHQSIVDTLTGIIGPNVKCMQSMYFIKAAGKPGQAWHQDEDYIPTRDRSLTGAWLALDDATVDNGCLWVIPGSHKPGVLWPQAFVDDEEFDCSEESYDFPYSDEQAIPVELKKGSVVYFNGYLLHRSLRNKKTQGYRRCLVNHYMSAESLLPWSLPGPDEPGVGMAKLDFRDFVLVAGKDPYSYMGKKDLRGAFIRPERQGGCLKDPVNDKAKSSM